MGMFSKPAINRRPEALADFKLAIDKAVAEARHWRVDVRDLVDIMDRRRESLLMHDAMTRPL
jgi:hypothetical protein